MQVNLPLYLCMSKDCEHTAKSVQELVEHTNSIHKFTLNLAVQVNISGFDVFNRDDPSDKPMKDLEIINSNGQLCSIKGAYKFSYALHEIFNFINEKKMTANSAGYEGDDLGVSSRVRPQQIGAKVFYPEWGMKDSEFRKIYNEYKCFGFSEEDVFLDLTARYGQLAYLMALRENISSIAVESLDCRLQDAKKFYAQILELFQNDQDILDRLKKIQFVGFRNIQRNEIYSLLDKYQPTHMFIDTRRMYQQNAKAILSSILYLVIPLKMLIWGKDNDFTLADFSSYNQYGYHRSFICRYHQLNGYCYYVYHNLDLKPISPGIVITVDKNLMKGDLHERFTKAILAQLNKEQETLNSQLSTSRIVQGGNGQNEKLLKVDRGNELHQEDSITKRQKLQSQQESNQIEMLSLELQSNYSFIDSVQYNLQLRRPSDLTKVFEMLLETQHQSELLTDVEIPQLLEIDYIHLSDEEILEIISENFQRQYFLKLSVEQQNKWIEGAVFFRAQSKSIEKFIKHLGDTANQFVLAQRKIEDMNRRVPLLEDQLEYVYEAELKSTGVIPIAKIWQGHNLIIYRCKVTAEFDRRGNLIVNAKNYLVCIPILGTLKKQSTAINHANFDLKSTNCVMEILMDFKFYESKALLMKDYQNTLSQLIETQALTKQQKQNITRLLVDVIAQANSKNINHLNLDTKCIMITDNDSPVLFFPESCDVLVGGTPGYQPPEQFIHKVKPEWHKVPNPMKVDSYALGVILYEIWSGQHPFTQQQVEQMQVKGKLPQLPRGITARRQKYNNVLYAIEKLLEEDPDERYTAAQVIKNIPLYYKD